MLFLVLAFCCCFLYGRLCNIVKCLFMGLCDRHTPCPIAKGRAGGGVTPSIFKNFQKGNVADERGLTIVGYVWYTVCDLAVAE